METFKVLITETLDRVIEVKANSYEEAEDIVSSQYATTEIELNADNSNVFVEFKEYEEV